MLRRTVTNVMSVIPIVLALGFVACEKKDDEEETSETATEEVAPGGAPGGQPGGDDGGGTGGDGETPPVLDAVMFLTDEQTSLAAGESVKTTSNSLIADKLKGMSELYANYPDDNEPDPSGAVYVAFMECYAAAYNSITVQAQADTYIIEGTTEVGDCFETYYTATFPAFTYNEITFNARIAVRETCPGRDLSEHNGTGLWDFLELEAGPCEGTSAETIYNFRSFETWDWVTSSPVHIESDVEKVSAIWAADKTPCEVTVTDSVATQKPCHNVEYDRRKKLEWDDVVQPTQGEVEIENAINTADLSFNVDGDPLFYSTGTIDVTYNNWSGSVTYTGPATEPSYSVGDGNETVNGTLPSDPHMSLTASPSLGWALGERLRRDIGK